MNLIQCEGSSEEKLKSFFSSSQKFSRGCRMLEGNLAVRGEQDVVYLSLSFESGTVFMIQPF